MMMQIYVTMKILFRSWPIRNLNKQTHSPRINTQIQNDKMFMKTLELW
jgi:hypothetical protein